jgi:hypothetical protein
MIGPIFRSHFTVDIGVEVPWETAGRKNPLDFVGYRRFDEIVTLDKLHFHRTQSRSGRPSVIPGD